MEYLVLPFIEIEIRLGTILSNKFDSCIDKKYFELINKSLNGGKWVSITKKNSMEYLSSKPNLRLINNTSLILKENILTKNIGIVNSPFDIRYSVNQEFSLKSHINNFSKTNCITRDKKRISYIDDNFRYDLTEVKEINNNITKEKFEIEFELIINKETLTWDSKYINDFIECKIYDLINIVEPMEREKFKINII